MKTYKCSCGTINKTEWCVKCGIRNTTKFNASRYNDTSSWSSNDFATYTATNSWSSSCDSSNIADSWSSDSSSCSSSGD